MKNLKAKAVCVMLSASMAAMGLTGCGSDNVDGTKTAVTVMTSRLHSDRQISC